MALIFETLNNITQDKGVKVHRDSEGFMHLEGVFGVCNKMNNNRRVYHTDNYRKMVEGLQERITHDGGVPGELEHPQNSNIDTNNISHVIERINIDENGTVSGRLKLLDTPKGKLVQAVVEGGCPICISSRAAGDVDESGNVTLSELYTYDLVSSPGFSEARLYIGESIDSDKIGFQLKDNEKPVKVKFLTESIYYIPDDTKNDKPKENILENIAMTAEEKKQFDELVESNKKLTNRLNTVEEELKKKPNVDVKVLSSAMQKWCNEQFAQSVQGWVKEQVLPVVNETIKKNNTDEKALFESIQDWTINEFAPQVQSWAVDEFAPQIQKWITEDYSTGVEKWINEDFAGKLRKWVVDEFGGGVEKWMNEEVLTKISDYLNTEFKDGIMESVKTTHGQDKFSHMDQVLTMLEGIDTTPKFSTAKMTLENKDSKNPGDPLYIQKMPADTKVKYDSASKELKESIARKASISKLTDDDSIKMFWESISFDEKKTPVSEVQVNNTEHNVSEMLKDWHKRF